MKELMLYLWNSNHHYAHQLLDAIPEEKMADQPAGLPNHPAWTLAHLSIAANYMLIPALGGKPIDLPAGKRSSATAANRATTYPNTPPRRS